MKLFGRYNRINVIANVIVFLIASSSFYFTLNFVFVHQIDEDLTIEEKEIETFVNEHNRLPESISVNDQQINYQTAFNRVRHHFTTTMMATHDENEQERFRQLVFGIKAENQWYKVTVSKSMEDAEDLANSIVVIALITILVILLVSFIINRVVLKKIWHPFYQSLAAVKEFKLGTQQALKLPNSAIDEFRFMNEILNKITSRAQLDYLALKTFSENASHEIQTPLAVIRSKLDLMAQDENLTQKQSESLQGAFNSVQKLTRLNQSLLLLAKIENNQFQDISSVNLKEKIEEKISEFHELWEAHGISTSVELKSISVTMNEELLDILLNNLFSNATRHNFNGGAIVISLNETILVIANASRMPQLDPKTLYQRFTKTANGFESNGLGLSIIKQICDNSGLNVHYRYEKEMHVFIIDWDNSSSRRIPFTQNNKTKPKRNL